MAQATPSHLKHFELLTFANDSALAQAVAREWLDLLREDKFSNEPHLVALSGGRIAKSFFGEVVEQAKIRQESFSQVHFFWADERCVPPTSPDSNFASADELLLRPLKISPERIHRLRGEFDPKIATQEAVKEIVTIAPQNKSGQPLLDVIFLGLGEDGHVASLFPGADGETVNCAWPYLYIANSPKPPPQRITLSYVAIAAAKEVWVLASGKGKEGALSESLSENGQTPLAHVLKSRGQTRIFSDIQIP